LARRLTEVRRYLQNKPPNVSDAVLALDEARELLFPFTEFHKAADDLYLRAFLCCLLWLVIFWRGSVEHFLYRILKRGGRRMISLPARPAGLGFLGSFIPRILALL
jgi:hypothetical protein